MAKNKNREKKQKEVVVQKPKTLVDKLFGLSHSGSSWKQEVLAGLTAFLGTAFILIMVPQMFGIAYPGQMQLKEIVAFATLIAVVLANLGQGLYANLPYVMAPSISTVILSFGVLMSISESPYLLFALFFVEAVIFVIITWLPWKKRFLQAFPPSIRYGAVVAIGGVLLMMALQASGIIGGLNFAGELGKQLASQPRFVLPLGNMNNLIDTKLIVFGAGLLILGYFVWMKSKTPYIWTMIATAAIGLIFVSEMVGGGNPLVGRITPIPTTFVNFEEGVITLPSIGVWASDYFVKLNLLGLFSKSIMLIVGFVVMMLAKDVVGTPAVLLGLAKQEGRMGENDDTFKNSDKAMQVASGTRLITSLFAAAPVEVGPESAIGVAAGGRTGITSLVYAGLALISIFFLPLFRFIPAIAVAPVMVAVGVSFARFVDQINWKNMLDAIPAFLIIAVSIVTFNIAFGIMWGIVAHLALRITVWKFDDTPAALWVLGALSVAAMILFYI